MSKEEWLNSQSSTFKDTDIKVLKFIADIRYHSGTGFTDVISKLFSAGYCYYFANMLKDAFKRGRLCYVYNTSHIVWVDVNKIAYDINGVYKGWEYLIPIEYLEDSISDYMHVQDLQSTMTENQIDGLICQLIEHGLYISK